MLGLMKVLHVLAAVLLLGNLIMAPFWRKRLAGNQDAQRRAVADQSVRVADMLFTLPGWVVILVTGIVLIILRGGSGGGGWLHVSVLLFLIWIVLWHVGTLRARKAMIAKADEGAASGQIPEDLTRYERKWAQWSYIAALVAVLILVFMVVQPF
jgi:uncharacterized membrane protein